MVNVRAAVIVLAAVVLSGCAVTSPDRGADVRRNLKLLADVPPYPSARVAGVASSREVEAETGAKDDHYTTVRTEVLGPHTALHAPASWYRLHLTKHGWRVRVFWEERVAGNAPPGVQIIGRRGVALVMVSITPSRGTTQIDILVDYLGNRLCHTRTQAGCW